MAKEHPNVSDRIKPRTMQGGSPCIVCGKNTQGKAIIQVNIFRGDDDVVRACPSESGVSIAQAYKNKMERELIPDLFPRAVRAFDLFGFDQYEISRMVSRKAIDDFMISRLKRIQLTRKKILIDARSVWSQAIAFVPDNDIIVHGPLGALQLILSRCKDGQNK